LIYGEPAPSVTADLHDVDCDCLVRARVKTTKSVPHTGRGDSSVVKKPSKSSQDLSNKLSQL
jgi:hypothetical protein